ncbi:MAG: DUF1697 domain-containing protein [Deltaproteobacteria bacterium]|nr:DUF1697 domain-containing protein [Deltaproteobacteria bacterium]
MTAWVALLRAINVGGRNRVPMAELRALLGELGLGEVRTLKQTGNVVFQSDRERAAGLEAMLEDAVAERMGVRTDFFVRSAAQWREIVAANPFPEAAERDPGHLVMLALKRAPEVDAVAALEAAISGRELVRADGAHLYAWYRDGIGRSKLTNALIERKLGVSSTGRNWNTVLALAELP